MRPILASPDLTGLTESLVLVWSWLVTAAFSLAALALVFWRRTREASILFAVGGMILSIFGGLALASYSSVLRHHGESIWQPGDHFWRDILVFFAPLMVAATVFCVALRALKKDRERTHAA